MDQATKKQLLAAVAERTNGNVRASSLDLRQNGRGLEVAVSWVLTTGRKLQTKGFYPAEVDIQQLADHLGKVAAFVAAYPNHWPTK